MRPRDWLLVLAVAQFALAAVIVVFDYFLF